MGRVLSGIKPENVFRIFEDICAIPHGSGNTKAISDYCVKFARSRGLFVYQDEFNNVIIKKPASKGYENHGAVALQGHLDMVCEKEADSDFNFLTDGLCLETDGDFVFAKGTTLGGDDGVAVAMALAILDDNSLSHPPLEVIFTTDEEIGMYGAVGLDTSSITAKKFINIDSENEGVFTVGCAGGCRVDMKLTLEPEKAEKQAYKVEVSGLSGGHSGTEISKGRLNAIKILGKFLGRLGEVRIADIWGGAKDNAIPVSAGCIFLSVSDVYSAAADFQNENRVPSDSNLEISIKPCECNRLLSLKQSKIIVDMLNELPYGIQSMSQDIKGLVQTSDNVGIMRLEGNKFCVSLSVRSSKKDEKSKLLNKLKSIAEKYGAGVCLRGDYPAWEYRESSPLRNTMSVVFNEMYGREPKIEVIHAGLECGLFSEKIKDIDAVSIGPDLFDIHTPRERLSISSLERTYKYICHALEAL